MTTLRAFGSEANRQALMEDVRSRGPVYASWLTTAALEGDLTPVSRDYGLHPAFCRLLPALGAFGEGEEAPAFYEALLGTIPLGAETGNLARRVLLRAWTDPDQGRARLVGPGPLREACEAVIALVRQSLGAAVDKPTWRAARARLAQAQRETAGPEPVIDLVLSLAWDLEQSPGAVQDAMLGWTRQVTTEAEAADEDPFTPAESALFQSTMDRINEEAFAVLQGAHGDDDPSYEAFLAEVNRLWAADEAASGLKVRSLARQARVKARLARWRAAVQQGVLADARALAG